MSLIVVALVAILGLSSVALGGQPLQKLEQTIPLEGVEGRFDHFGVDVEGKRLYVAALANNTMEVIDLAAGKRIQSVSSLKKPCGIRVLPESRNVVVASGDDGMVRIFSQDLKLLGTVNDLDDADNVRLSPDGKLAYVGYGDGAIAIIDPQQFKMIGSIKLDGHPEAFQLERNGPRLFVNVPGAKHVAVIDRDKRAVIAKWPIHDAQANFPIALDEANHRLFIGCRKPSKLLVLDTETGKPVAALECSGDTDDLFYDTRARRIYVTGGDGSITTFEQTDADHYRLQGTVQTAAGARTSLFVPEMGMLYVAIPHRGAQRAEIRAYRPADDR